MNALACNPFAAIASPRTPLRDRLPVRAPVPAKQRVPPTDLLLDVERLALKALLRRWRRPSVTPSRPAA